jgi:hypothetical protein
MRRPCPSDWRTLRVGGLRRCRSLVRPRSNSEAAGDDQTDGFALSPYVPVSRTVIVGLSQPGCEVCCGLHLRPTLPLKEEGDAPIPTKEAYHPRVGPHRCVANIGVFLGDNDYAPIRPRLSFSNQPLSACAT